MKKQLLKTIRLRSLLLAAITLLTGATSVWGDETQTTLFHETFGENTGSARAWDDSYSVKSGVSSVYSGITSYTVTNAKQGKNTTGSTGSGLNQSTAGTDAELIVGPLNVASYQSLSLTYQWKAASIKGTYSTSLYYATSATGDYTEVTGTGTGATTFVERSYDLPDAACVATLYLKIVWNTSNTQAIIDELDLKGVENTSGKEMPTLEVEGYTGPTFLKGSSMDLTITTNSASEINMALAGMNSGAYAIYTSDLTQENGTATVTVYPNEVGTSTLTFSVAETEAYAAKDVTLTFNVRKRLTQTVIVTTGITNTDITSGTTAGSLLAQMKQEKTDGTYETYLTSSGHSDLFTWSSSDQNVATVGSDGTVTLVGAGTTTITANFIGTGIFEASSATYELTVTDSNAPAVETATFDFPNMGYENQTEVTTATSGDITIAFDKGTSNNSPKYYTNGTAVRAYGGNTFTISSSTKIIKKIVITFGESDGTNAITTDVDTYEAGTWTGSAKAVTFTIGGSSGNRRIQTITVTYEEADQSVSEAPTISGETSFINETEVTITAAEGAAIYYTTNGDDPTTSSTAYTEPFTLSASATVKAIAVESGKEASEVTSKEFTKISVMTVAEAIAYIETLGSEASEEDVYVSGIVSQVDSYNSTYSSITYWISDDGTTTTQMEVFSGKGLNGENFSASDDLQPGDEVVVCGKVQKYNNTTPEFIQNSKLISLVLHRKESTGLNYATLNVTKAIGNEPFTNPLTNPNNLAVTYASSNETVATVDANGEVTLVAAGTTTITASYPGDDTYLEGSASYTLTVNEAFTVQDGVFDFVRAADAGYDYDSGVQTTNQSNHYETEASTWTAVNVTLVAGGSYRWWYNGHELRFKKNDGTMTISVPAGKEITNIVVSGGTDWTTDCGTYSNGTWTGSSQTVVFTAGSNSGNNVTKIVVTYTDGETESVTVSAAGFATYCSENALDFTNAEIKAFIGTRNGTSLVFNPINQVPANTGILLYKDGGATEDIPVIASAAAVESNCLVGVTSQTTINANDYILSRSTDGVGFYKAGSHTTLGANKAYIPAETGGNIKSFAINFGDADGINSIENRTLTIENVYNLAGQRVEKLTKGIYVVNGKKVAVR